MEHNNHDPYFGYNDNGASLTDARCHAVPFDDVQMGHPDPRVETRATFGIRFSYHNETSRDITVVDRTGMRMTLPASPTPLKDCLVVRVEITWSAQRSPNFQHMAESDDPIDQLWLEAIQRGQGRRINRPYGDYRAELDIDIRMEDIVQNGGTIYVRSIDKVISVAAEAFISPHPFSTKGMKNQMLESEPQVNDVETFGFAIRIVDPRSEFGPHYINIQNTVYHVPVKNHSEWPEGIYVLSKGAPQGGVLSHPRWKRYSFAEGAKIMGLYPSIHEARHHGDAKANYSHQKREAEMAMEQENIRLKEEEQTARRERVEAEQKLNAQKQEYESERMEAQRRAQEREARHKEREAAHKEREAKLKEELDRERFEREKESLHQKAQHEKSSLWRKTIVELIKQIPAFIGGVFTAGLALLQWRARMKA